MKFSSSLKFNAVTEWWDEYLAYDALKKHIYQLEKRQNGLRRSYHDLEAADEETALMGHEAEASTDSAFIPLLDQELKKICSFYEIQERELFEEIAALERLVDQQEGFGPNAGYQYADEHLVGDEDDDEDDEDEQEDLFDVPSPTISREQTLSPKSRRRRHSRSLSAGIAPGGTNGIDQGLNRRWSTSSDGQHDLQASVLSTRSTGPTDYLAPGTDSSGAGGSSRSPLQRARALASKLNLVRDSTASDPHGETVWTAKNNYARDTQLLFKRRITKVYVSAISLRSYVELNYSGFRKILKKYDKVTDNKLLERYLHGVVENAEPFTPQAKDRLNNAITTLVNLYARCVTQDDEPAAKRQLKLHQREHIAWERDTVWRQMIGQARRGETNLNGQVLGGTLLVAPETEKGLVDVRTPIGRLWLTLRHLQLLLAVSVFVVLLNVRSVSELEEANRCFAILVFATVLWATEAIPLFVTSMAVPLLLVCLRVIRLPDPDDDEEVVRASAHQAAQFIFAAMFSSTIMLLIGGFTIASALSKTAIDRILITKVLSFAGTRPRTVLLAFMGVACFASMWISNVAAPTLCFTLIQPILRNLPPKSPFAPCLILAIALAANIGGQTSPISSPQNIIALDQMDPKIDWAHWFAVAIPVSVISILLIWLLLLVSYRPEMSPDGEEELEIKPIRPTREPFTRKQWWVTLVCVVTIGLWCFEHAIEDWVGDMGVIALIPVIAFFSTGVLKKDDFENFLWTVVFLAMGGIALGKGVTSSGLLDVMDEGIRAVIEGRNLASVIFVLSIIVLVVSTFISHTIASVLLVPIAREVGSKMPGNHQNMLIFLTGLICSCGMGMPVSGFPNQTAATQVDDMGQLYLSNIDFLKNGVPASVIATIVVSTVGYFLMWAVGIQ